MSSYHFILLFITLISTLQPQHFGISGSFRKTRCWRIKDLLCILAARNRQKAMIWYTDTPMISYDSTGTSHIFLLYPTGNSHFYTLYRSGFLSVCFDMNFDMNNALRFKVLRFDGLSVSYGQTKKDSTRNVSEFSRKHSKSFELCRATYR